MLSSLGLPFGLRQSLTRNISPPCEPGNSRSRVETFKKLESAPARVTCGILTFLAISAWTQAFNAELPKVSYIKAIDVWTVSCNLFVFLSLMEYAFAQGPVLTQEI